MTEQLELGQIDDPYTRRALERLSLRSVGATGATGPVGPAGATGPAGPTGGGVDVDAKADFGARGDGTSDDAPAINDALAACPSGGVVWLPAPAVAWRQSVPIIVPPNVTLRAGHGNRIDYKFASDGIAVPQKNVLKPFSSFVGSAAIRLLDMEEGGYSGESGHQRVENLTIDGSVLAAGSAVDGVRATGRVREVVLDRVACQYMPRGGVICATYTRADSSVVHPYSWDVLNCVARACANFSFAFPGMTDSEIFNCLSLGAGVSGFFCSGMANSHVTDCRAEWSVQHGFLVTGASSNGGTEFTGISTDRNGFDGVHVDATGKAPLLFNGMMLRRDGRNGKAGGGGYAGFRAQSATCPVLVDGFSVFTGQDDDATGVFSPEIGVRASGSTAMIDNGYAQGFVTPVKDDGDNANFYVGREVIRATGNPFLPSIVHFPVSGSPAVFDPADAAMLAWSDDPALCNQAISPTTAGIIFARRVKLPDAILPGKVWFMVNAAGSGTPAANVYAGVALPDGTLVGVSTDQAAQTTTTGPKSAALTVVAGQSLDLRSAYGWLLFLVGTQSGTPFVLRGPANAASVINAGCTVATPWRSGSHGSGLSALQNIVVSSLASVNGPWLGLS